MNEVAEATLYAALVTSGLVAGGQLFCLLAIIPAFEDWSPRAGVSVHQHGLSERPHRYLRVLSPITCLTAIATVAIEHSADAAVILTGIGAGLAIFNGIYSQREWPINHEIDSFGDSPSEEQMSRYTATLRKTWDSQHLVRTVASILALGCFTAAATFF